MRSPSTSPAPAVASFLFTATNVAGPRSITPTVPQLPPAATTPFREPPAEPFLFGLHHHHHHQTFAHNGAGQGAAELLSVTAQPTGKPLRSPGKGES